MSKLVERREGVLERVMRYHDVGGLGRKVAGSLHHLHAELLGEPPGVWIGFNTDPLGYIESCEHVPGAASEIDDDVRRRDVGRKFGGRNSRIDLSGAKLVARVSIPALAYVVRANLSRALFTGQSGHTIVLERAIRRAPQFRPLRLQRQGAP